MEECNTILSAYTKYVCTHPSICERVEKIVGVGEKKRLPAFYPFPTMFSKMIYCKVVKSWACVVRG